MTPDLAAQIRDLIAQTRSPVAILETPEPLTEDEWADLVARFRAAQLRPHEEIKVIPRALTDRVADALLAVLELHAEARPGLFVATGPMCEHCYGVPGVEEEDGQWPCATMLTVAEKLGIEVAT